MHKSLSMYLFLFITLYMFRAHRAHHQGDCINTASGNSHSMLVAEMCAGWKKTLLCGYLSSNSIMSLKNSSGTIENRTGDLPVCSVVP